MSVHYSFIHLFEVGSHFVSYSGLTFTILPPQPPLGYGDQCVPHHVWLGKTYYSLKT